jgi:hypothetical protein
VAGAVAIGVLAGCSPQADPDTAAEAAPAGASSSATRFYEPDESQRLVFECLDTQGWEVTFQERDHSIGATVSAAEWERYEQAMDQCRQKFPVEVLPPSEWTQEQWDWMYAAESRTAECLRREGYSVPRIPSKEIYIERYTTTDRWSAYSSVGPADDSEWQAINNTCPQPGEQEGAP